MKFLYTLMNRVLGARGTYSATATAEATGRGLGRVFGTRKMNGMRRYFGGALCLGALMFGLGAQAAENVPYFSAIGEAEGFCQGWTAVDVDGDGYESSGTAHAKWVPFAAASDQSYLADSPCQYGVRYYYSSYNPANDWMISPAISLQAGKEYKMRLAVYARGSSESGRVMMASAADVEALAEGTELAKHETYLNGWNKDAVVFTVPEDGEYYFGIQCYSATNKWWVFATDFQVVENSFSPAAPSALQYAAGTAENPKALTLTLNWTLPTTDYDGNEMPEGVAIEGVKVYRDGELLASLGADAVSFTDNAEQGLTSGIHTYAVSVVAGGVESPKTEITTAYVGPLAAAALPYDSNFTTATSDDFALQWTQLAGEQSTLTGSYDKWDFRTNLAAYPNRAQFSVGYNQTEDNWLISPPIAIPAKGNYKVTINVATSYHNTGEKMEVCAGLAPSIASMTLPVIGDVAFTTDYQQSSQEATVAVNEPGDYYFGLHINGQTASSSHYYYVYSLRVEKVGSEETFPTAVTDLTATPAAMPVRETTLSWTNPEYDAPYSLQIYCDNTLVQTIANDPTDPENLTSSYVVSHKAPGAYSFTIKALNENGRGTAAGIATASVDWVGAWEIPYMDDEYDLWTIFNVNDDYNTADGSPKTWEKKLNGLWIYSTSVEADDYAISPILWLEPSKVYTVTVWTNYGLDGTDGNQVSVKLGTSCAPEAMTTLLGEISCHQQYKGSAQADEFKVCTDPELLGTTDPQYAAILPSGSYYLGVHANTKTSLYVPKVAIAGEDMPTGIAVLTTENDLLNASDLRVYDLTGRRVTLTENSRGLYILRGTVNGREQTLKIMR